MVVWAMAAVRMSACELGISLVVDSGIGDNREQTH